MKKSFMKNGILKTHRKDIAFLLILAMLLSTNGMTTFAQNDGSVMDLIDINTHEIDNVDALNIDVEDVKTLGMGAISNASGSDIVIDSALDMPLDEDDEWEQGYEDIPEEIIEENDINNVLSDNLDEPDEGNNIEDTQVEEEDEEDNIVYNASSSEATSDIQSIESDDDIEETKKGYYEDELEDTEEPTEESESVEDIDSEENVVETQTEDVEDNDIYDDATSSEATDISDDEQEVVILNVDTDDKEDEEYNNATSSEATDISDDEEVMIDLQKDATPSDIDKDDALLATDSIIQQEKVVLYKSSDMSFYDQLCQYTNNVDIVNDKIVLQDDIEVKDTLYIAENVSLDLNSHHIYISLSTVSECINIKNATFNLYDTSVDLSTYEYFDEEDIKEKAGSITSMVDGATLMKAENAVLNFYGGTIKASKSADAIVSYDTNITIDGAMIYGGDGIDSKTQKGEDGKRAIVFYATDKKYNIEALNGYVRGGNGGKGRGRIKALPGAGYRTNDGMLVLGHYLRGPFSGYAGEEGGGNGGVGIDIDSPLGYGVVCIQDGKIYGGNGGKGTMLFKSINKLRGSDPALPAKFDSREYATSIKNQGATGVCWDFSTIASAEIGIAKDYPTYIETLENPDMKISDGDVKGEVDLSEIQLAYYFYNPQQDPLGIAGKGGITEKYDDGTPMNSNWYLNMGADIQMVNIFLSQGKGIARGSDYKTHQAMQELVESGDEKTTRLFGSASRLDSAIREVVKNDTHKYDLPVKLESSVIVRRSDYDEDEGLETEEDRNIAFSNAMKKYIKEYGSVQLGVASGGSTAKKIELSGIEYTAANRTNEAPPDHAVLVVGWDDNFDKSNFMPPAHNNGALLIKNSWGSDKGYFWIPYEWPHNPQMSLFIANKWKKEDKKENLYYVDSGYNGGGFPLTDIANVYQIKKDSEILKSVGYFHTQYTANSAYYTKNIKADLKIYKINGSSTNNVGNAFSTNPLVSIDDVIITPGYNNIEIPGGIEVKKDEYILVALTNLENIDYQGKGVAIFLATTYEDKYIFSGKNMTDTYLHTLVRNTTYVKRDSGGSWMSMDSAKTPNGEYIKPNARIRLLTTTNDGVEEDNSTYRVVYQKATPSNASSVVSGTVARSALTKYADKVRISSSPSNKYTLKGWTHIGWASVSNATKVEYEFGEEYTAEELHAPKQENAEVTLYPVWKPYTYTMKFEVDTKYSTSTYSDIIVKYDDDVTLPTFDDPDMVGLVFDKWKDNNASPSVTYDNSEKIIKPNFTDEDNGTYNMEATFDIYTFKIRLNMATPSKIASPSRIATPSTWTIIKETNETYLSDVQLQKVNYAFEGFKFEGWSDTKGGTALFTDGQKITSKAFIVDKLGLNSTTFVDEMTIDLYSVFKIKATSSEPSTPSEPTKPSTPSEPEKPIEPVKPVEPAKPSDSGAKDYYGGSGGSGGGGGGGGGLSTNKSTLQANPTIANPAANQAVGTDQSLTGPATSPSKQIIKDVQLIVNENGQTVVVSNTKGLLTGWQRIDNGSGDGYYFMQEDGTIYTGWIQDNVGNYYHLNTNTGKMDVGKVYINGYECNFGTNGLYTGDIGVIALTQPIIMEACNGYWSYDPTSNAWGYLVRNSENQIKDVMRDGLYKINDKYYLFDELGNMLIGCQQIEGKIYVFEAGENDKGKLLYECILVDGEIACIDPENISAKEPEFLVEKTSDRMGLGTTLPQQMGQGATISQNQSMSDIERILSSLRANSMPNNASNYTSNANNILGNISSMTSGGASGGMSFSITDKMGTELSDDESYSASNDMGYNNTRGMGYSNTNRPGSSSSSADSPTMDEVISSPRAHTP